MGNEWANQLRTTLLEIAGLMVAFGLLVVLVKAFFASLRKPKAFKADLYEAIPNLLSESEARFYEALYAAVGQQFPSSTQSRTL